MRRLAGRYPTMEYYIEIEYLPDKQLFSPTDIARRKYDKRTQPELFNKMFQAIYQFTVRNSLTLCPDNCVRHPSGRPIIVAGRARLREGERHAKWTGKTWKSKLYSDDRITFKRYTQTRLVATLARVLKKRRAAEKRPAAVISSQPASPTVRFMRKRLWVAALMAAILITAGTFYNYNYLSEGYAVLRNDGPKAAFEFFQNRGETYDNLFGMAWAAFRKGDYVEADALSHRVLKSRSIKDQARASYLLGILKTTEGDYAVAKEHLLTALAIYESTGETYGKYQTWLTLARLFLAKKEVGNALYYANLAETNQKAHGDHYYLYLKSQIAFLQNDYEAALSFALQREKVFRGDRSQLTDIYSEIGFYYGLMGQLDRCFDFTIKAQGVATSQGDSLAQMYNNINWLLYLKCSFRDYAFLRGKILYFAQAKKDIKLIEQVDFIDKFTCVFNQTGAGHPDPPDEPPPNPPPPSATQTSFSNDDAKNR